MYSPSEASEEVTRATRAGFAEMNGITEVTIEFIAYVAVLVSASTSQF